jgi:hypothetical protein
MTLNSIRTRVLIVGTTTNCNISIALDMYINN